MFSVVSVCLSTRGKGSHMTITHALNLTVQSPPSDMRPHSTNLAPWTWNPPGYGTSLYRTPPRQTCNLTVIPHHQSWYLVAMVRNRWYASPVQTFICNSFLLTGLKFDCTVRDFLSPWYWILIDFNVIPNCIQKFVLTGMLSCISDFFSTQNSYVSVLF